MLGIDNGVVSPAKSSVIHGVGIVCLGRVAYLEHLVHRRLEARHTMHHWHPRSHHRATHHHRRRRSHWCSHSREASASEHLSEGIRGLRHNLSRSRLAHRSSHGSVVLEYSWHDLVGINGRRLHEVREHVGSLSSHESANVWSLMAGLSELVQLSPLVVDLLLPGYLGLLLS